MVPEHSEEVSAAVGRCNHKDLGSPRWGALGEQSQNQQHCTQAPQQVLLRTPQHWGCCSSKIQWVMLIVLFFYIGESGNSSKTDGYEFYWVVYPVSTVFEGRKNTTWRASWKTEGFWFLKWDTSSCLGRILEAALAFCYLSQSENMTLFGHEM